MAEIHSVLVTGANRGIGLAFVKQFLSNALVRTHIVIATCRSPQTATTLQELKKSHENLHILTLDVTKFDTFDTVASETKNIVGDKGLTLLINNAGMSAKMSDIETLNADKLMLVLTTNAAAPLLFTKAFYPLLKSSARMNAKTNDNGLSIFRAAVINVSSRRGSIMLAGTDNFQIGYDYPASKAALNMITQMMGRQFLEEGILVEAFHPGRVATDMTVPFSPKSELMDAETSVTGMLKVMMRLTGKNKEGFYDWEGNLLPH